MKLGKCVRCGKYVPTHHINGLCSDCTGSLDTARGRIIQAIDQFGKRTAGEIARFADVPDDEVARIIEEPEVQQLLNASRPQCTRCGARAAQRDSEYCLECRIELSEVLGSATRELAAQIESKGKAERTAPAARGPGVFETLDKKRGRTSP